MEKRGVCENCFWDHSCVFHEGREPVWNCEEHTVLVPGTGARGKTLKPVKKAGKGKKKKN